MELPSDGELSTESSSSDPEDSGNDDNTSSILSPSSPSLSMSNRPMSMSLSKVPKDGSGSPGNEVEMANSIKELFERLNSTIEPESSNYVLKH